MFQLYDTFGFPPDLTIDVAKERGLKVDFAAFEEEMIKQREKSKAAGQFSVDYNEALQLEGETEFTGYEKLSDRGEVTALISQGTHVNEIEQGREGVVVLNRTPFYAESGGQIGDTGMLFFETGSFRVKDTTRQGVVYLHHGVVEQGTLNIGDDVTAEVDSSRQAIVLNHSATHLLHAALRRVLGDHVIQKGSLVESERLRFDFCHHSPMTPDEIREVERLVNQQIRANLHCEVEVMTPEQAEKKGALALFGEKYGDQVRVLSMGDFSMELCGGTHVHHSGEVGLFLITQETGIAAGIRRIEAVSGEYAYEWQNKQQQLLAKTAGLLKTDQSQLLTKLKQSIAQQKELEKKVESLTHQLLNFQSQQLIEKSVDIQGVSVLAEEIASTNAKALRVTVDQLKREMADAVIILATVADDKVQLVAGVSKSYQNKVNAGQLVRYVAEQIGGRGGGRADMAEGGGTNPAALAQALSSVENWVKQQLG